MKFETFYYIWQFLNRLTIIINNLPVNEVKDICT